MKLAITEDQTILRESLRRFVERQIPALATDQAPPAALLERLRPKLNELGLWGLTAPVESGGFGQDTLTAALAIEELAMRAPSLALLAALHLGVFAPILASSSIAKTLLSGEARIAIAIDDFVLAPADGADHLLIIRRQPAATIKLLNNPDLQLSPTLGLEGVHTGSFDGARFQEAQTLEITPAQLEERLGRTSTLLGAVAIGLGQAALNEALTYAEERQQFGRPLNRFQAIQFKIADMGTALETSRWLLWRAAATENSTLASFALEQAAQAAFFTADEALQIHGGYGYTQEYAVEALFRHTQELRRLSHRWLSLASSGLLV